MSTNTERRYPGGSKNRVSRAGDAVRKGQATQEDYEVIEEWRAAHRKVLNTFQAILRNRTRGQDVIVAQRHKRRNTIFNKLLRLPGMQLARMDDVAGCRLIFENIEMLEQFRRDFHTARFQHRLRNDVDRYDYIKSPKASGYRGIHDIYEYNVNSESGKDLAGLYIEVQYRTLIQHAWATAVEVIGFITESQPKFQQGDERYEHAMALASEILARVHEQRFGAFPDLSDEELLQQFLDLDSELSLIEQLKSLSGAEDLSLNKYQNKILNIAADATSLEVLSFRNATEAIRVLFDLEKRFPKNDIVLVRADTPNNMRQAFRNYFQDATEFIRLVERGCTALSQKRKK